MLNAIIQLSNKAADIHFTPQTMQNLHDSCNLLSPAPLPDLKTLDDPALLGRAEILITGWGSQAVDMALLKRMPDLRLIAHLAGTVKSIVSLDVMRSGVQVTHAASANARPVAEFVLAAILLHNKRVQDWAALYRAKRSGLQIRTENIHASVGNRDKVIGIVGASRVGRHLIALLANHNLRVMLFDPYVSAAEAQALGVEPVSLDRLIAECDVVSLHQPLLPSTERSFGAREFAMLRDGALLINTARGGIIDHDALIAALGGGRFSALLDVTDPEPLADDSPLWDMKNVLLTPHIAGSLGTEVSDMTEMVIDEINRFTRGEPLNHEVTADVWERVA